jgi:formate dehydrogenase gamma subunit
MSEEKQMIEPIPEIPRRFTVPQRIEHLLLAVSFTALGLTGLIQKFAAYRTADRLIELLGGIESTRIIHRGAAIVFSVLCVYHLIVILYKIFVHRVEMTMMPRLKDVVDALRSIGYNLFLTKEHPKMPRYNYAEKLEYWALIWGGIIMIVTGFMLWNPLITAKFLPGQFIPAAKAAHGGEALLAVLAIIVWHFYNVHLRTFNTSMFTGKLSRHQMEEEHGEEWNQVMSGAMRAAFAPAVLRRRKLYFAPIAAVIAAAGAGSIYWGATAEKTAISTLPTPVSSPPIYNPAPRPALPTVTTIISAPRITHPIEGQEQCYRCHGAPGIKAVPANHVGRPIESCPICHRPAPVSKIKKASEEKANATGPKPIPHATDVEPFKDCQLCHGIGKAKPFPENHAKYAVAMCKACHKVTAKPAAGN